MSKRPVIFLSFADDQDAHLDLLKKESRDIYRVLQPLHDKGFIEIYREESASIEDIFYNFQRFKDRVAIFHYGGHANGSHLRLDDQTADAQGLAKMMGEQSNLQLVVLNGCSTLNQVKKLREVGIPAIIATSVPVQDSMAMDFGVQLYQAMANGADIQSAFNQAIAFLQTKYGSDQSAQIFRSIFLEEDIESDEIPWGLYLNEEKENALSWVLPTHKEVALPEGLGQSIKEKYKVNEYLVTVLEAMAKHHKPLYREMEDEWGDPRDPREYPELIIKNFPWPIGSQLRILVANSDMMNKPSPSRLKQLVHTYTVSTRFMSYILLSQLWDEKEKKKLDFGKEFDAITKIEGDVGKLYDFMSLIDKVRIVFKDKSIEPFIEEYHLLFDSLDKKDDTYDAYQFMESLRTQVNDESFDLAKIEELCNQAEFCLTVVLKRIAFMAKYRLVTVKDISIFKPKRKEAQFQIQIGVLNAFDKEFLRERTKNQDAYTDSHSVLVVKSLRDMDEYLNLSPFVIDKNAFAGKPIPNIFMYTQQIGDDYQYLTVNYNITKAKPDDADLIETQDETYAILKEQFQLFQSEIG